MIVYSSYAFASVRVYMCMCVRAFVWILILPLCLDVTQGQFLSGVNLVWIQVFLIDWLIN